VPELALRRIAQTARHAEQALDWDATHPVRRRTHVAKSFRRRIWELVEVMHGPDDDAILDWYDIGLFTLICLNVVAVILETVEPLRANLAPFFWWFEVFSVAVFTAEYVIRIWACTADERYADAFWGRVRYATTPLVVIDFLAFAPFYLAVLPLDLRFLRALRLFRLLRVLKLGRYSKSIAVMGDVLRAKASDLVSSVLALSVMLVISASVMYYAEHDAQPDKFASIPESMWWAVCTLTTVGYGDVFPVTPLGKLAASVISILGIGLFAIPTGILAAGYSEARSRSENALPDTCPHCGGQLEETAAED
jgi:voltage-gated potassium channel